MINLSHDYFWPTLIAFILTGTYFYVSFKKGIVKAFEVMTWIMALSFLSILAIGLLGGPQFFGGLIVGFMGNEVFHIVRRKQEW